MSDETFPSGGRRRSLLIGINYAGQKAQLEGCVNDVQKMRGVLEKVGFPQYEQRILVDHPPIVGAWGKPTKEKIIESLKWLTEGARPGDTLFLHYSGHGVQIPDDDGDEADGMDEALVPLDYLTAGVIRDDLIHEIVVKHLPSGIRVTAVMDCCHSGTLLDLPYEWVASDTSMHSMLTKARSFIKGDGTWFSRAINQIGLNLMRAPSKTRITKRDFVLSNQKHILCDAVAFSGCRDEESCADVATSGTTTLSTIEAGSSGGVCTAALVEALESGETFTFIDLLYRMREILKKLDFTQVPQLSSSKPVDMQRPFSFFGPIDEYVVKRDDENESATSTFNTDVGESQSEHDDPSENVTFPSMKLVHDFERQPNQPVPTMTTLSVTRTEQETEKTSIFSSNTSQSSTAHMFSPTYSNSNSGMVHNNNNNNNVSFTLNAVASSNLPSSIPSNTNSSQQLATKSYLNDASSSTSLFPSRSPNSPTARYTTFNSSNKGSTSPRSLNLNSSLGRSEFPSLTVNTAPDTSSFNFVPQTPLSPVMVTPASPTAAGSPRGSLFYDKPASPKSGSVPGKYNALPESVGSGASSSYGSSSPSGGNQFKSTVENSTGYYSSIPGSISNHKNTNETYDMVSSSPSSMNMKQSPSFYIRNDQRSEEQVTMNSTSDTTSFASNISGSQTTLGISAQEQQYSAPSTQQLGYATTVTVSPTASFAANYTPVSPSGTVVNTAATYTPISASMAGAQTYCPVPTYASSSTLPYSVPNTYVQQNYYSSPTHAVQSEVYTSPSGYYTAAPQMVYYSGAAPSYSSPTYVMGSYY